MFRIWQQKSLPNSISVGQHVVRDCTLNNWFYMILSQNCGVNIRYEMSEVRNRKKTGEMKLERLNVFERRYHLK